MECFLSMFSFQNWFSRLVVVSLVGNFQLYNFRFRVRIETKIVSLKEAGGLHCRPISLYCQLRKLKCPFVDKTENFQYRTIIIQTEET